MDVERIIDEIEQLQEMFEAADIRPLSASDLMAATLAPGVRRQPTTQDLDALFASLGGPPS